MSNGSSRIITIGGAQLGPVARAESRQSVVNRMLTLLRKAHGRGCRAAGMASAD